MLDFLGTAVSSREIYFENVEQVIRASSAMANQNKRITRYLKAAREFINEPLRIGILGEVNSGKTELANLILGVPFLPSSVINNTQCPTLIRFGEEITVRNYRDPKVFDERDASVLHKLVQKNGHLVECRIPIPLLKLIEIIDFPSFDNFDPYHESSRSLLCRNQLLVWCSSSVRTWTASEKSAWEKLPAELKDYCVFVVTHADKLAEPALEAVMARLELEAGPFRIPPISIATTIAIQARSPRGQIVNRNLWETSGGAQLFEKLGDLLQKSLMKRQQRINDNIVKLSEEAPVAGGSPVASNSQRNDPPILVEWRALKRRFASNGHAPGDLNSIVQASMTFKITICEPWLQSQNRPSTEIEDFLALLPNRVEDLTPKSHRQMDSWLLMAFDQIEEEMREYIAFINQNK